MEWCEAESPDSPFAFQDYDFNNANDDFFFPVDDFQEFPLSSPNDEYATSPEQDSYPDDGVHTEELLSDAVTPKVSDTSPPESGNGQQVGIRKQQVASHFAQKNSAFNNYILSGLSSVSQPSQASQDTMSTQQQQERAPPLFPPPSTSICHSAYQPNHSASEQSPMHQNDRRKSRSAHRPGSTPKETPTCSRCQFLKLKCDGEIPCWRCVRKGVGEQCCRPTQRSFVDAPMPWRRDGYIQFGIADEAVIGPQKPNTVVEFMSGMVGKKLGVNPSWIDAIVGNITPKLYTALSDTIGKLLATDPQLAGLNPRAMTKISSAKAFDLYPSTPYMRQVFDWKNATLEVEINRKLAVFFNKHPEELLDRLSRNTMQPFFTEFDMLCAALDDLPLMMGGLPNGTSWTQRYHFGSQCCEETGQYMVNVFRSTAKAVYDEKGRLKFIEKWMQPATLEEYDIASEKTPELCRPLQRAVGDRRKGAEIASTHMHERYNESIAAMSFSRGLRQKLDALADAVRTRYAPLVEHVVKKRREAAEARLAALPDP